jgi:hypothetical protein
MVSVLEGAGESASDAPAASAEVQWVAVFVGSQGAGRAVAGESSYGFRVQPDAAVRGEPVGSVVVVACELLGGGVQHEFVALPLAR